MNKTVTSVMGCQWGDEGKGKLIDILAGKYDLIARATGGANAGHTVYIPTADGKTKKHVFHLLPSGIFHENTQCVIGNGVVLHLETLLQELDALKEEGITALSRLYISDRAHLVFNYHKIVDGLQEDTKGHKKIETTKRGIGPAYSSKISRTGIRVNELKNFSKFQELYLENLKYYQDIYRFEYDPEPELSNHQKYFEILKEQIIDTSAYLNQKLKNNKSILIEGANGTLLDIDHGTYPFVTSSNSSVGGLLTGLGIAPQYFQDNIGVFKAYCTRVGAGPFPTEIHDQTAEDIRRIGGEYGSTTGRPRRCGWFDAVAAKYAIDINGITSINLTKLDVLSGLKEILIGVKYQIEDSEYTDTVLGDCDMLAKAKVEYISLPGWDEDISSARSYGDLPKNTQDYIEKLQEIIGVKITSIGVGTKRSDIIFI
ncbi:adenylosuccinate synthase [Candidatus Peregrinibacteria bacterium HGW-Peregrinibacteria-1]|jgi:adenylosuccinate synthase|nr:MAG: adenylosuccinate synthase [Candidatus Peregrinibacteria bacterium HGW-Peregrinibacteria-1]